MLRINRPAKPRTIPVATPLGMIEVMVKRSRQARRMLLRLDASGDGFALTLPTYASITEATAFVKSQAGWMTERLKRVPPRIEFSDGATVPLLGEDIVIRHVGGQGRPVVREGAELLVTGAPEHLKRRVRDHLIAVARTEITAYAKGFAAEIGHPIRRITIRDTTSRWGSCSPTGELSLSWRLILMPREVLRYVVAHEVAHLAELNHGPHFWKLVDRLVPDSRPCRAWLTRHGQATLRYG